MKILRAIGIALFALVMFIAFAWACGALFYDGPGKALTVIGAVAIIAVLIFVKPWKVKLGIFALWFFSILGWWLTLKPTNTADWQPDVAQLARAEINGDVVTLHNVRNCDYRSDTDCTPRWETRTVNLSRLTGIDMAIDYWGSPYIAHPIVSFQFSDAPRFVFQSRPARSRARATPRPVASTGSMS